MDPFITLREMWREAWAPKVLLAVVLVLAVVAGMLVAYRPGVPPESRRYEVWLSSAEILVDTSEPQVVDTQGADVTTLANRATLLGNLMTAGPLKDAIAERAGIPPGRLVVVPPANPSTPDVKPAAVATAAGSRIPDSEATILTLTTGATVPILGVTAQAPNRGAAEKLAAAPVEELERYLDTVAPGEEIPAARKLVVQQLGAPTPQLETRGPHWLLALAVAVLVALLGFLAILVVPWLYRRWKLAEEAVNAGGWGPEALGDPIAPEPISQPAPTAPPEPIEAAPGGGPGGVRAGGGPSAEAAGEPRARRGGRGRRSGARAEEPAEPQREGRRGRKDGRSR